MTWLRPSLIIGTRRSARALRLVGSVACAVSCGCNLAFPLGDYQALDPDGLVQQATAQGANTRSLEVTLPSDARGDAFILVAASTDTIPIDVAGGGVTWQQHAASSNHVSLAVWVGFVPSTGSQVTVTITWPAAPAVAQATALVHLSEWVGPTALGLGAVNDGIGGPISTSSLTVEDDAALIVAAAGAHEAAIGAPTNGLVALETIAADDTRLVAAYLLAPPAGTYATSWPYPSTNGWEAILVSFAR